MKYIFLFLAIILFGPATGQIFNPPGDLPKEYWKELDRPSKREIRKELRDQQGFEKEGSDEFDFVIPEVPLPVTERVQAEGNWARTYLEIPENEKEIRSKLKGKFCMALLDTGEPDHAEVVKYKYPGHKSVSMTGEPVIDGHFHATHVAGSQVAKVRDTPLGVAHTAADNGNFRLAFYKVCTNRGGCSFRWMAEAIRDFTAYYKDELKPQGWDAGINMSIGGTTSSADLSAAMNEALAEGIVIFASAGNGARNEISYPARDKSANAVGAHDNTGLKASFSNSGPELFMNGPGVLIYSTCLGDTECLSSGTSMSSPQVAAAYALLQIMRPDWEPEEVLDFMARHGTDLGDPGFDEEYGYGTPKFRIYLDNIGGVEDPPTCGDGKKNGKEKGIDCGGPDCPPCLQQGVMEILQNGTWRWKNDKN